jgi:hypothetical protein
VIGGPPCQGFSAHRKKDSGKVDARNELVTAFATIVKRLSPELFVFENVPEVASERHWGGFERLRRILERCGYNVRAQIHNLAGFGVGRPIQASTVSLLSPVSARIPASQPFADSRHRSPLFASVRWRLRLFAKPRNRLRLRIQTSQNQGNAFSNFSWYETAIWLNRSNEPPNNPRVRGGHEAPWRFASATRSRYGSV